MIFVGPISSIFDYATFGIMLFVFDCWSKPALFQTGWFVESLLTQTLIIHIIRTAKIPFIESRASSALIATTIAVCAFGIALPFTTAGAVLGFTHLPLTYWPIILANSCVLWEPYALGQDLVRAPVGHVIRSAWFVVRSIPGGYLCCGA